MLAAATLVGCSGTTAARSAESRRGAPAAGSRSTPPSPASVPTTGTTLRRAPKPAPPYSFDGSVAPPRIVDTGSNLVAIGTSLVYYSQWLYAHDPDDALIPRFAARASRVEAAATKDLGLLRKYNRRIYEVETRASHFSVISTDGTAASLRFVQYLSWRRAVRPGGLVVDELSFVPPTTYVVVMVKNSQQRWRLVTLEQLAS
jgi:hypothetical protein